MSKAVFTQITSVYRDKQLKLIKLDGKPILFGVLSASGKILRETPITSKPK